MPLQTNCAFCGKPLKYNSANLIALAEGLPLTSDTHDPSAKSEMHYAHCGGKNSRDQFENIADACWQQMGVQHRFGSKVCCFECHEVVLHNPVLSEAQIDQLASLFRGKSFEERVVMLNRVIDAGLRQLCES
jgi:hypothetical protein